MRASAELRAKAAEAVDRITGKRSTDVAGDWRRVEAYLNQAYEAVKRDAGAQPGDVEHRAGREPRHDDARHREFVERQSAAEPWFQQLCGFFLAEGAHLDDARMAAQRLGGGGRVAIEVAAGSGAKLHRDFARDVGLPFGGGGRDQEHRAGGDGGKEGHDRDHGDQRAAGDRGARHDRRQIARPRREQALACEVHQWEMFVYPTHRCANAPDAAPSAARRIDPSASRHGLR